MGARLLIVADISFLPCFLPFHLALPPPVSSTEEEEVSYPIIEFGEGTRPVQHSPFLPALGVTEAECIYALLLTVRSFTGTVSYEEVVTSRVNDYSGMLC